MRKQFNDILAAVESNKGVVSLDEIRDGETEPDESLWPTFEDSFDRYGWEKMFHLIPKDELEVLVCLYLGFKPSEIVKMLHYPNIVRYYNVSGRLRKTYQQQKMACLDV